MDESVVDFHGHLHGDGEAMITKLKVSFQLSRLKRSLFFLSSFCRSLSLCGTCLEKRKGGSKVEDFIYLFIYFQKHVSQFLGRINGPATRTI